MTITWDGTAFMLNSSDWDSGRTLSITLGKDKASALASLNQMLSWMKASKNKESLIFEDAGRQLTLYKQDGSQMILTDGDATYAAKKHTNIIMSSTPEELMGFKKYKPDSASPHFSFVKKDALNQAIKAMNKLNEADFVSKAAESDSTAVK